MLPRNQNPSRCPPQPDINPVLGLQRHGDGLRNLRQIPQRLDPVEPLEQTNGQVPGLGEGVLFWRRSVRCGEWGLKRGSKKEKGSHWPPLFFCNGERLGERGFDSRPRQILGPPEKGRNVQSSLRFSHRSGLKSSASSPHRSRRRCMA